MAGPPDFGDSSDSDSDEEGLVTETTKPPPAAAAAKKRKKPDKAASSKKSGGNDGGTTAAAEKDDGAKTKKPPKKKKKKESHQKKGGFIDDAAVESGSEDDDDEDEDEEGLNDYERDGFVVDEEDIEEVDKPEKKKSGDLEDSDEEDEEDDDDDDDDDEKPGKQQRKKLKKNQFILDDDDLDLINEAQGLPSASHRQEIEEEKEERRKVEREKLVMGRNEKELSQGLFDDDDDDDATSKKKAAPPQTQKPTRPERYDEDGLDDFIEDDVGDGGYQERSAGDDVMVSGGVGGGVSESMLQEHLDIFGTDFMEFMEDGKADRDDDDDFDDDRKKKRRKNTYRERGVGVDLGVDSEDELIEDDSDSEDDDDDDDRDLFGDDDMDQDMGDKQRAEVLKLKREKKRMAKEERRRERREHIEKKRKAQLRRAFEPVQLVENFCTERDDAIRMTDSPERYYDWLEANPSKRTLPKVADEITEDEEEESFWIMQKITAIQSEWSSFSASLATPGEMSPMAEDESEKKERAVLTSITYALRFMRVEKLEPEFIKRYRQDVVSSPAVRSNLYRIMDEDSEWERMTDARSKIESILTAESNKADDGEELIILKDQLKAAEEKLGNTVTDEERVKVEIVDLEKAVAASSNSENEKKDEDNDDDDLFGDDDDDDDEEAKEAKVKQKESLKSHLSTITTLLNAQAEEVARLDTLCREKEAESAAAALGVASSEGTDIVNVFSQRAKKMCKDKLWHYGDYSEYVLSMIEHRQVMDMKGYLSLIKEGNEAIKDKTSLLGGAAAAGDNDKQDKKKRSRRFDWDYYRTCVSEGLRAICYKFVLPPFRVGIKLEDTLTSKTGFSYDKTLPGDDGEDADMEIGDPRQWVAPVIEGLNPQEFGSQLIDSGELVSLATQREDAAWDDNPELTDPLRACRYVAAMELAHEPRIRRQLRAIYRSEAVITTRPTSKGMGMIDAFHEYYGLHLLRDKPVKEHFPMDESELGKKRARLTTDEVKELDVELKKKETNSCIQYLNLLKAERSGDISLHVHLPYLNDVMSDMDTPWYKRSPDTLSRDKQDIGRLMEALERVYLPANGDTDEWNDERRKILRMALVSYLLPQFEAEMRRDLRDVSTRVGVEAAGQNLQAMAMEGPYRPSHLLGENRFIVPTGDLPIVGVCSSNDSRDGTFLAAINGRGELSDHVAIPGGTSVTADNTREKVITFLMQTRPAAVVVGSGGGVGSRITARRLGEVITQATERWNRRNIQGQDEDDEDFEARSSAFRMMHPGIDEEDEEGDWKCNVDIVDDNVAQLFGRSVRGNKEFPDTAVNLKVAIATARWAKDPLCELAYTWSAASDAGVFGTEMLFLNIHPLQRLLPKPSLLREFERVLCKVTAEVGVDINGACSYDHMHGMLTFVPGLGPRKANNLKQNVARIGGVVSSRKSILAKRLLGPIVYNNSVAFLRVRATDQLQDQMLHPLDDSRCHPDVYQRNRWAVKIAVDALELGDGAAQDDEYAISAIRDVMQNSRDEVDRLFTATKAEWEGVYGPTFNVTTWDPKVTVPADLWNDKVEELDIDAFSQMIEQNGNGKWLSQLTLVKWEFRVPFEDPRKPMEPPSGEKLFKLLTGESDATFCPGKEVTGKVVKNGDFGSQVKLEGDVPGFIPLRNLADDHVESAEDIVSVGTVVTALITQVKMDHMCVDLTLKKEDFKKKSSEWERPMSLPPLDDHFDKMAALKIDEEKDKEREKRLEALRLTIGGTKIGGDSQGGDADGSGALARRSGKVTRRACAHPAFRNATHDKLDKELKESGDAMVGEALIRPSNKSCDSLAIHWMVRPGCIKIIEVLEEDKDTDASVGNRLIIKKEVYESIDELLGRYIAPMNDRVEEVQHHRKFLDKLEDEIDDKLQVMKKANPAGVFYFVCWSECYPGYVSLRFVMGRTPRHHTIGISPDGFVWGPKTYSSMDRLMNDFKKNPAGPGARPPNRPSGGSSAGSSMSTSRQGTGGRTEESNRLSRWGARSSAAPPSRWGGALPPPPAGPPPTFAAPPGQPPAFSRPPPPSNAPPGYSL